MILPRRICPVCQHGLKTLVSPISAFPEHPRRGVIAICLCCADLIIARKNNTFVRFPGENFSLLSLEDRNEIRRMLAFLKYTHEQLEKAKVNAKTKLPQPAQRKGSRAVQRRR